MPEQHCSAVQPCTAGTQLWPEEPHFGQAAGVFSLQPAMNRKQCSGAQPCPSGRWPHEQSVGALMALHCRHAAGGFSLRGC